MNLKSVLLVSALAVAGAARAADLAAWNFESLNANPPSASAFNDYTLAAESGTGTFTGHHDAPTVYKGLSGNGSAKALSSQIWNVGDYYQFSTSTLGFGGPVVSFDQQGTVNGPRDFDFAYSTNGTMFTTFASYTESTDSWAPDGGRKAISFKSFDLSGVAALANQSTVFFRLIDSSTAAINAGLPGGTVDTSSTGGSSRVDNILVSAAPVPEPSSIAALGLAAVALLRRRRKA